MSKHTLLTRRRAAALREMADLGCTSVQAAMLLQIDKARVSQIKKDFGITMPKGVAIKPDWLRRLILRDFGKPGITDSVMATRYGTTANSISATISKLRREGVLPPSPRSHPKRHDLSYFHISSAVNYQKW